MAPHTTAWQFQITFSSQTLRSCEFLSHRSDARTQGQKNLKQTITNDSFPRSSRSHNLHITAAVAANIAADIITRRVWTERVIRGFDSTNIHAKMAPDDTATAMNDGGNTVLNSYYGSIEPDASRLSTSSAAAAAAAADVDVDVDTSEQSPRTSRPATYLDIVVENEGFRYFLMSYMITHAGEWLTYIATISFIEEQMDQQSRTAISLLIFIRLIPNVLLFGLGGSLADSVDRRKLMILLDVCGALCSLLFIVAYNLESIALIYVVAFAQNCVAGLYAPSWCSILPMLVDDNEEHLQKANIMAGLAWSVMMALGSALGGYVTSTLGSTACFLLDSLTYCASAYLLRLISGSFKVTELYNEDGSAKRPLKDEVQANAVSVEGSDKDDDDASNDNDDGDDDGDDEEDQHKRTAGSVPPNTGTIAMTMECLDYLRNSDFGLLVLMKGSSCLAYGGVDILSVAISEQGPTANASTRLGTIFACVGAGCLIGPLVSENFTSLDRPWTLQISCIVSFGLIGAGLSAWAVVDSFWLQCVFTIVRASGSSIVYIDSDILLQKFAKPTMLGRVMALDYAFALLAESLTAFLCGYIMDSNPEVFTVKAMSSCLATTSLLFILFWSWYHVTGHGATHPDVIADAQLGGMCTSTATESAGGRQKKQSSQTSLK